MLSSHMYTKLTDITLPKLNIILLKTIEIHQKIDFSSDMKLRKLERKKEQFYLIQQGQGKKELKRYVCLFYSFF